MRGAEQAKEDALNALVVRLNRGFLPGEVIPTARAPAEQVVASAQQNLQHHASSGAGPSGRPSGSSSSSGGGGGSSSGGGGGARQGGDGAGAGADEEEDGGQGDDDDDEPDVEFRHFYHVTPQQRTFNLKAKHHFKASAASCNTPIYRPPDVIKRG